MNKNEIKFLISLIKTIHYAEYDTIGEISEDIIEQLCHKHHINQSKWNKIKDCFNEIETEEHEDTFIINYNEVFVGIKRI